MTVHPVVREVISDGYRTTRTMKECMDGNCDDSIARASKEKGQTYVFCCLMKSQRE